MRTVGVVGTMHGCERVNNPFSSSFLTTLQHCCITSFLGSKGRCKGNFREGAMGKLLRRRLEDDRPPSQPSFIPLCNLFCISLCNLCTPLHLPLNPLCIYLTKGFETGADAGFGLFCQRQSPCIFLAGTISHILSHIPNPIPANLLNCCQLWRVGQPFFLNFHCFHVPLITFKVK